MKDIVIMINPSFSEYGAYKCMELAEVSEDERVRFRYLVDNFLEIV